MAAADPGWKHRAVFVWGAFIVILSSGSRAWAQAGATQLPKGATPSDGTDGTAAPVLTPSPTPTAIQMLTPAPPPSPSPANVAATATATIDPFTLASGTRITFFLAGVEEAFPQDARTAIAAAADVPSQLPNEIPLALSATGRYRNVAVFALPSAPREPAVYRVEALLQRRVTDVSISGLGFLEEAQYKRLLKSKIGAPFVEEDLLEDVERLQKRLANRGYLKAKIAPPLTETSSSGDVRLSYEVDRGRPCRVAEIFVEPDAGVFDFITSPVEAGSICDVVNIEDALEREKGKLRAEGFLDADLRFARIDYTPDKERAVVRLRVDRGRRTRIEVVNLSSGAVTEEFGQGKGGLSPAELVYLSEDELRSEVQGGYQKRGYASAVVTGPNKYESPGGENVFRYFVQPGPQVFIGQIDFRGALPLPRKEIIERLDLAPGFFSSRVPFVEIDLPKQREKLLSVAFDEGYADAKVEGPSVNLTSDGRTANLIFRTSLGPRYLVRDLTVIGKPAEFTADEEVFERVLGPGTPVSQARLRKLEEETKIEMLRLGYAYAQVKAEPNVLPADGGQRPVQILMTIEAGPVVRVGKVFAEGELYGKGDRSIKESGLEPGDLFTPENLERARFRVLRHDLYGNVQVEPLSPSALAEKKQVIDVVIRTQGRGGYSLGLGPGYGSRNGYRFTVDFAKNNLTRDGLRLNTSASLSQEKQQKAFNATRQLLGRKITVGLVEPLFRFGSWVSPFDVSTTGGLEVAAGSLSNRFYETLDVGFSYKPYFLDVSWNFYTKFAHEWSRVIGSGLEPIEALDRPTLRIHEIIFGVGVDTRNNVEWPTRGTLVDVSSSHARFGLYSEVQYDRFGFDISQYFPIYGRFSGALGGGVTKISNVVNARRETVTAPSSRRGSLTGRSQVRGFPDSGVGPGPLIWLDLRTPKSNPDLPCSPDLRRIGATNVLYVKGETRYRTPWFDEALGFAWFVDSGSTYFSDSEQKAITARLDEFNARAAGATDEGRNSCVIRGAKLVGNDAVNIKDTSVLKQYAQRSYLSTGVGARIIISNLASINIDWGFPVYDPAERGGECDTIEQATATAGKAPTCVKRRADDKLFGLLTVPGAFFVGIGANF